MAFPLKGCGDLGASSLVSEACSPPPHFSFDVKGCAAPRQKKSSSLSPRRGLRSGIFPAAPLDVKRKPSRPAAFPPTFGSLFENKRKTLIVP